MQITITSNCAAVAAQLGIAASDIQAGIEAGLKAATEKVALPADKARLEVIYQQAIPDSPTGRPLWKRTGHLRDAEQAVFSSPNSAVIQTDPSSPAWAYSEPRHELQTPGRTNPWRTESMEELEANPELIATFEDAFKERVGIIT